MAALPVIKNWAAWRVEFGTRVLLGLDPFIGGAPSFKLSEALLSFLHGRGIYTLAHIYSPISSEDLFPFSCLIAQDLGLPEGLKVEWDCYTQALKQNAIDLTNEPDRLVWTWNMADGVVTVKEAHNALVHLADVEDHKWWYSLIWKIKVPIKIILFMWLSLNNKVLTGENFRRRGGIGPSVCPLCLNNEETI